MTHPDRAVPDVPAAPGRAPRALVAAAVAWIAEAAVLVGAWIGATPATDDSVARIRGQLGDTSVAVGPQAGPVPPVVLVILAGALVLLAAALLLGRGSARFPVVLLGVAGVVLLALGGRWETVAAMVLVLVGTVPLLFPSVHRWLGPRGVVEARP